MGSPLLTSSLGSTVTGIGATLLALALLVQVLQEIWKYVFRTRADVFARVLTDFIGPVALRLTDSSALPGFVARGPFQFMKLRPSGMLLPLGKDDLIAALEHISAPWYRRALLALHAEADVQQGTPGGASQLWRSFMRELVDTAPGGPGDQQRMDLIRYLGEIGSSAVGEPTQPFDAAQALRIFRERFMPHVVTVDRGFDRLSQLFDYQYQRRNTLLSFVLGIIVAFSLGFPIQKIYVRAAALSPDQAAALAANAQALYRQLADTTSAQRQSAGPQVDSRSRAPLASDTTLQRLKVHIDTVLSLLRDDQAHQDDRSATLFAGVLEFFAFTDWPSRIWYVLGCLATALFIVFGAPFWNGLLDTVSLKTGMRAAGSKATDTHTTGVAHV
jgi:hypothetical protein